MAVHFLRTTQRIEQPLERVFDFFSRAENLGAITPAELQFRIDTPLPITMAVGTLIDYTIRLHGLPMKWRTRITTWEPPHSFTDEQLRGPYALWVHTHRFRADGPGATVMEDEVRYQLPLGVFGSLALPIVRRQLEGIFAFRRQEVERLLGRHASAA